jgi:DNA gyrase/topoisomerase IV subunit B
LSAEKNPAGHSYDASQIQVLEGLDPVRKRPGMYIGSTGYEGLHHLIKELADNGIDEVIAGYANEVSVVLHRDGSATISDNGRGIPVDMHPKTKKNTLETVLTTLHAGGKFGSGGYKVSSGLHGVGSSVVNALSSKMVAVVMRDGFTWRQEYKEGKPTTKLIKGEPTKDTGTIITFYPDLTAVMLVKIPDPQFEGQTKNKLGNPEVRGYVESVMNEWFAYYFEEHPAIARKIINKGLLAARARRAARAARDNIIRKGALDGASLPGKLADCATKDRSQAELFIVEGQSAGGSAKDGRNSYYQAILPLRGKVLNVERARLDKMLANQEILNLIKALGVGIEDQFDLAGLRYERIIIMTDADVDGSHITTLLMTLLFRHMRPILEAGHIYVAQPPLFAINAGKKKTYAYNDEELEEAITKLIEERKAKGVKVDSKEDRIKQAGVSVSRYKGLGEMDAEQLWETTMDPANRILVQVKIEDAEKADAIFSKLMGTEVEMRKNFIQSRAKFVKDLDI